MPFRYFKKNIESNLNSFLVVIIQLSSAID